MDAQLIAFTGVAAGMVAMPGADFTVVVRNALISRRAGVACALGITGGLLLHTALAVAGIAAVLAAVPALFRALQLAGGAYVLYLGIRTLWSVRRPRTATGEEPTPRTPHPLRQGFVTNALNPKAPVTFLSLLPQFVPAGAPALPRTLLLALIVVALALVWFPAVALLVDRLGRWLRRPRAARTLEGVTGAALTVLGATLLLEAG
ncbi:lysine transporter LysE [Streptomyces spinoverrucosus]|uniref:Lysine transporter LysE n=1 Tax=Streptomyces spinoverrucosus TaxID=284043 RepID=A0A4Y3VII5_9ACTN|nr:LysE family translocator [Streptomyces spinoverrucosus]GEC05620.1 lysine transporter LysE [Streptomyces spinoverrucosus]GHB77635.1 lysine transporter LysE [Streptomyces spinoverrucosus]